MNTLEQHKKQIQATLEFLAKAKFSSAQNLQLAAGRIRRGFPSQLCKLGLVVGRVVAGGQMIYGLSKRAANEMGVPKFDIYKVGLARVEHALIVQNETLKAVNDLKLANYEFEPQSYSHDTRPDAVWKMIQGHSIFIEVELSAKSKADGDLDRFFLKLISRMTIVVFRDQVLFDRYTKYAREYAERGIPNWQNLEGVWIKFDEMISVTDEQWRKVFFRLHPQSNLDSLSEIINPSPIQEYIFL